MQTVSIDSSFFCTYSTERELYENVKLWIRENLVGIMIRLDEINQDVVLSWQGLKNDLNEYHPPYDKKLISFSRLPEIVKHSKFIVRENEKTGKPDVKAVYKFQGSVVFDKQEYDVIIIIKETAKTFLYDHVLLEKK